MLAGELTRRAIASQPEWLAQVQGGPPLPPGRVVFTGCGTSFHAAQTGGEAIQALEAVLHPPKAELLVALSHEGTTPITTEAVEAFDGPRWLVTGVADSPLARHCDEVIVATPEVEESYCHTASYTCAVATLAEMRGEDVSWLAGAVAEAHHTEQLLHGDLAAIDETVRCFVLEGTGRAAERARGAVAALEALGCDVTLVPSVHPVVDVVRFQLLTVDLADARGVDPDRIRREDPRWEAARDTYE